MKTAKKNIDVRKFLPHRKSMLMIDEMLELTDSITKTKFLITKSNIFVEEDNFIEIGIIENIAQTCSIIVGSSYFYEDDGKEENNSEVIGFISAIKEINIYGLPKVNEVLFSTGKLISRFDGDGFSICTLSGEVYCEKKLILDCQLNLFIKKNLE